MKFINNDSAKILYHLETPYLVFPVLSEIPYIKHGFSTRLGGVSEGIYATMNLDSDSLPEKDDPNKIRTNFERIAQSIGVDPHSIVISKQVHKTDIRVVHEEDRGKGLYIPRDFDEIDGLITNETGITLVTKYADCVPLFFVDTRNKAIGLSHAGWRGTVAEMGAKTVAKMGEEYQTLPEDLTVVIGPSICGECYEVGHEVALEFQHLFENKGYNIDKILTNHGNGKYHLNLWECNKQILMGVGVPENQIHISGVCTSCNDDLFFSHRKTQGKRGSLAAFLALI